MAKNDEIWVAITGMFEHSAVVSTSLSGIADEIGASYATLKRKVNKHGKFRILVGGDSGKSWYILKTKLVKIKGRGGLRNIEGFLGYRK